MVVPCNGCKGTGVLLHVFRSVLLGAACRAGSSWTCGLPGASQPCCTHPGCWLAGPQALSRLQHAPPKAGSPISRRMSSEEDYGGSDYGDQSMGDYSDGEGYGSEEAFDYGSDEAVEASSPLAKGTKVGWRLREHPRAPRQPPCRPRRRTAAAGGRQRQQLGGGASPPAVRPARHPAAEDLPSTGQGGAAGPAQGRGGPGAGGSKLGGVGWAVFAATARLSDSTPCLGCRPRGACMV